MYVFAISVGIAAKRNKTMTKAAMAKQNPSKQNEVIIFCEIL